MVPLRDHLAWDIDAMLDAIRPETRLLYLANPNNPTGAHVGRGELERLLRELPEPVMAVIDEAYFEFPDADDYASALEMRDLRERLIVLRTFSKAYGMATHRVGYAITTPIAADYLNRVRAPFNVGAVNQAAARAALTDDLLDAAAAAWSAGRYRRGEARSFPTEPDPPGDVIWA